MDPGQLKLLLTTKKSKKGRKRYKTTLRKKNIVKTHLGALVDIILRREREAAVRNAILIK